MLWRRQPCWILKLTHFYLVHLLGSPLGPLTYASEVEVSKGQVVEVELHRKIRWGVVGESVPEPDFSCKPLKMTDGFFPERILKVARFLATYYFSSLGEALNLFSPFRNHPTLETLEIDLSVKLSAEQEKAYQTISSQSVSVLFGDTGSGKTEIYIWLMRDALKQGKSAILLMPEIALTPQMEKRLHAYFGEKVAIWHSKITKKKREKILQDVESGDVRIIAGARSALFLPLADPGLIIVDEAHDDSYKSQSRPRYHAKDLAIYAGEQWGAKVVLGSATPLAVDYAKHPVVRLQGSYHGAQKQYHFEDAVCELSPRVLEKLKETVEKGGQAVVFLPTRANFKYLVCHSCGENLSCPFCSVGLSLHKQKNHLRCHYCNYVSAIPKECPECGEPDFYSKRMGTAEVAEQLSEFFPKVSIEKFDRDAITTDARLRKTLKAFNDRKIDILVGTQMLSKGHDYHGVSLAVVLGIDYVLGSADYRARERAVSLLVQIAGRAGRKQDGEILIQTKNREFFEGYLNNYEALLQEELHFRQGLYPPDKRLLSVHFASPDDVKAKMQMETSLKRLEQIEGIEIVGSGKAAIEKIANRFRYTILLRSNSPKKLLEAGWSIKDAGIELDMDPVHFL